MSLPRSILYPIDFSERCRIVWPAVAGMAKLLDAPITLLHAVDIDRLERSELTRSLTTIRCDAHQQLNAFPDVQLGPKCLQRELMEGPAVGCIVQAAAKMDAPMIMLPTRGHTRFRQMVLGSITAGVLHEAACPVWTEAHVETKAPPVAYGSMVCAVDMGARTPELLQAAMDFSGAFGAALHVVHCVPHGDGRFDNALSNRAHALLMDDAREYFAAHCEKAGVDLPLEIAEQPGLVDGLRSVILKHHADLLIIGRGVIQGALGRLRSNAHNLIRCSPCPVLSI